MLAYEGHIPIARTSIQCISSLIDTELPKGLVLSNTKLQSMV